MIILAIVSLVLGVAGGQWLFSGETVELFGDISEYTLSLLMFSVGISVGANKLIFRKLRENNMKLLFVPLGVIAGSLLGGYITGLLCGMPGNISMAIASGLGWYSLSGVMLTDLAGAEVGTVTFLANVFREIFSFLIIPWIAVHLNHYTAIAPAGATSEDTTLPLIMKCTSEEVAVVSVLNGVICSIAVPFLIEITFKLPF
ncbi:MAG: lysine exporter LysO family protein [Hydrogenoanaerobacterium sp.]